MPTPANNNEPTRMPVPTASAYVQLTRSSFTASAAGKETAGQMLRTSRLALCIVGAAIGPIAMAKAIELTTMEMPWQVPAGLIALAAVAPVILYWITRRRRS